PPASTSGVTPSRLQRFFSTAKRVLSAKKKTGSQVIGSDSSVTRNSVTFKPRSPQARVIHHRRDARNILFKPRLATSAPSYISLGRSSQPVDLAPDFQVQ